jgi:hypothetical protein
MDYCSKKIIQKMSSRGQQQILKTIQYFVRYVKKVLENISSEEILFFILHNI